MIGKSFALEVCARERLSRFFIAPAIHVMLAAACCASVRFAQQRFKIRSWYCRAGRRAD